MVCQTFSKLLSSLCSYTNGYFVKFQKSLAPLFLKLRLNIKNVVYTNFTIFTQFLGRFFIHLGNTSIQIASLNYRLDNISDQYNFCIKLKENY